MILLILWQKYLEYVQMKSNPRTIFWGQNKLINFFALNNRNYTYFLNILCTQSYFI